MTSQYKWTNRILGCYHDGFELEIAALIFFAELIFKNRMSELEIELDFKSVGSVLNLNKITCTRPKFSKNKELELTSVLPISVKSNFNSTKRACELVCSG